MLRQVMTGAAALLIVGSAASAEELSDSGVAGGPWFDSPSGSAAAVSITQNSDTSILESGAIACGSTAGGYTTQNQYLRRFFLNADHGIVDEFTVESVDFGTEQVEDATGVPAAVILTFNVYSIASGDAFIYANLVLEDTAAIEVTTADEGTFSNVAIGGVFSDPVGTDLVVEMVAPDGTDLGISHRPGINLQPVTQTMYLAADGCGIAEPTPIGDLGDFADRQMVIVVNGDEAGTVPTEDATWSEVKSLF